MRISTTHPTLIDHARKTHVPKVLHIFGRMQRGGAELRTLELIRALEPGEFQIHFCILTGLPGTLDDEIRALGGVIHYEPLNTSFPLRFCALLRRERYDVVHTHIHYMSGAIVMLAALCGVPMRIAHFRSSSDGRGDSPYRRVLRRILHKWIDRYATDILAVSESTMIAAWGADWRKDRRCRVIYNGLDLARFDAPCDRARVRQEMGAPVDSPLYIHVGRFDPPKNHARLIEIFAAIAERDHRAHLLLAGRGGNAIEAAVRRRVQELGLADRVILAGEKRDIPRLLKAADAMIFPSLWEGLPGAVLEACAAGTPVVAGNLPVMEEIAPLLDGLTIVDLAASNDVWAREAIAAARAGADPTCREQYRARFAASAFTLDRCVAAHRAIWNGEGSC